MRISPLAQVFTGLLCSFLMLMAGCSSPSSQTLDSLTVTATPSTVSVGGASVLKAVAHLSDGTTQDVTAGTTWTVSNPALASMSNGAITAKAAGTVTVQAAYVEATPAGTSPASATVSPANLSASTQVTITATNSPTADNVPAITWAAPAAISYGTALGATQLNATANAAGTFVYTPAAGTVLKAGKQTLSLVFTPSDTKTYSAATASVQLSVNQAVPTITWATPAPIVAGTALSATQLDATASVPGSFVYNPVNGAVLAAGTQQLSAVFVPTDAIDYSSATAHTSLTITSASNPPTPAPPTPAPPTPNPPTPNPPSGPVSGPIGPVPSSCGGPTINLNPGMSQSTLQSTIASAPDCSLIVFAAGNYNITSQISIPCPKTGLTITGPAASYPGPYTAVLNGSVGGNWGFSFGSCASNVTIEYLTWNGGEPAAGGGGFLYVAPTTSNLTVQYNYLHGNQANVSNGNEYDSLIWFDGTDTDPPSLYDNNDTVQWNIFGNSNDGTAANADCGAISGLFTYQGGTFDAVGGFCAAIGVHSSTNKLSILNNVIRYQEQGMKFYEGGTTVASLFWAYNMNVSYNDISFIHRISIEDQQSPNPAYWTNNDLHDQVNPAWGSWGLSLPSLPVNNVQNNVLIANLVRPGATSAGPGGCECWGSGYANNNLSQGYWGSEVDYGYGGFSSISRNIFQQLAGSTYFQPEYSNLGVPTLTANVTTQAVSAVMSAAPTISPTSTNGSSPVTVTLTDTGVTNGGVGPQGNTTIYYTTDGSTPTTSSTVCNPTPGSTSCSFSVPPGATVKAIGMWGALNQPKSYPAGYGFVPSSVVTASVVKRPGAGAQISAARGTATESATPAASSGQAAAALQSVTVVPSAPVVTIGGTAQLKAIATFSDGSVKDVTAEFGWRSSDPRTITANASGMLVGLASGAAVVSGSYQGQQASVSAGSAIGAVDWSGPIVISEGGVYSGNWQSTDARTPAVTVATTAPVIIENSHIRSVGGLIRTSVAGSNLTVRNSLGVALNAATKGLPNGIFLEVASPARLDVENNYIENAQGGVIVHGYAGNRDGEQTIVIRSNRARNLNGLLSDGNGGYLPGEGTNRSLARFIQFDSVQAVPGIDVGWNEVINYPGRSLVEDNIDVYRSGGTPNQPLEIHDTYIQGAYPFKAAQDAYTGGGIKTDAKPGDSAQEVPAFNSIHDNQVVGTVNYGIQFAAGHDNVAANNRVISSGLLADGTRIRAQRVGMANADATGAAGSGSMYNNAMRDNLIGWTCWQASCEPEGYRKDLYFPASPADYSTNSVVAARQITLDMENNEYQVWVNKMAAAGVAVGPSF